MSKAAWRTAPLGTLAASERNAITDGPFGSKLKTEHYTSAGPRVIRLKNIGDAEFIDAKAHISDEHFLTLQKHRVYPGDVVIAALGENPPRSCLIPDWLGPAVVKADCIRFKAGPQILPQFLNYALNAPSLRRYAKAIIHGVGRPRLNLGEIKALPVPVPPLEEQRRIVGEIEQQFSRLKAGVTALRQVQAKLKRYRAAVLKAACEGQLVLTEGSWASVKVKDLGEVQLGRQRSPKHHSGDFMRPYLRVANVYEDRIDLTDVMQMNFTPAEFETFKLLPNDVLLNEGQSLDLVGRPALYRDELPGACFQNTLVRFRPGPHVEPKFALIVFRNFMHTGQFQKIARWTTNIAHLGAGRFAEMLFPLPSLAEQTRIVAEVERRLSVVNELEATVAANLRRAARLRQSILQRAFSGRLLPAAA